MKKNMKRILVLLVALLVSGALAQNDTADYEGLERAYFAGGCFWCVEADFEKHEGVVEAISGYTGGELENPTYKQVSTDTTGHREAVEVIYDPELVSYQELLDIFWRLHDPTDGEGSFVDRGFQYSTAIYVNTNEERALAEGAIEALNASGKFDEPIATEVIDATPFYLAEDYHQDYYKKSATKYGFYRRLSGRDQFVNSNWKDDDTVYQLEALVSN